MQLLDSGPYGVPTISRRGGASPDHRSFGLANTHKMRSFPHVSIGRDLHTAEAGG